MLFLLTFHLVNIFLCSIGYLFTFILYGLIFTIKKEFLKILLISSLPILFLVTWVFTVVNKKVLIMVIEIYYLLFFLLICYSFKLWGHKEWLNWTEMIVLNLTLLSMVYFWFIIVYDITQQYCFTDLHMNVWWFHFLKNLFFSNELFLHSCRKSRWGMYLWWSMKFCQIFVPHLLRWSCNFCYSFY